MSTADCLVCGSTRTARRKIQNGSPESRVIATPGGRVYAAYEPWS